MADMSMDDMRFLQRVLKDRPFQSGQSPLELTEEEQERRRKQARNADWDAPPNTGPHMTPDSDML